jgi:hypothetical protein
VRGLVNPVTGVFSADGRSFYVGSLGNGGIFAFARDGATGRLAPVSGGPACIGHQLGCDRSAHPMPDALAISNDGRFLYAGGAGAEDGLLAFSRDTATGARSRPRVACTATGTRVSTRAARATAARARSRCRPTTASS